MKRILSLILLLGLTYGMYAQKSYVTVMGCNYSDDVYLSGDIPTGMLNYYSSSTLKAKQGSSSDRIETTIGVILNMLSKEGFELEQQSVANWTARGTSSRLVILYTLSKKTSGSSTKIRIITPDGDDANDVEVTEVARYNLQGLPVKESDKGLQIIVYSNYTTKTVLVQ